MKSQVSVLLVTLLASAGVAACARSASSEDTGTSNAPLLGGGGINVNTGSRNLHLEKALRFNDPNPPGSDADHGRQLFGLAPDLDTSDTTNALFQGPSQVFGGDVVSNGRSCFTCHRGTSQNFGLPRPPLSATIPSTDPIFTGVQADAQGDPDALGNLDQHAILKYRPNRFNLQRPESDPYRQVFGWRKSPKLRNIVFAHGFLTDGRGRVMFETDRGAVFAHTQSSDERFDDLFGLPQGNDLQAFQFQRMTDAALTPLLDPNDPNFDKLASDPFATVPLTTQQQKHGAVVFANQCMDCHNTPNVFNSLENVSPTGTGERPDNFPTFAPAVGKLYDVGVAELNKHGLRFTQFVAPSSYQPIVLPMTDWSGNVQNVTVTFDVGLAATTARVEDVGRFKVPQLRWLKDNGPYFHDNSADTIEEVVDYFNGPQYNHSKDGKLHPVHLSKSERADLIAFLYQL